MIKLIKIITYCSLINGMIFANPFDFVQSTQQAAYFFVDVSINDNIVASDDWVGAFNGDICVGARQWDIDLCGNGVCEVGEVESVCFKDCMDEFKSQICQVANAGKLCGEKCPALAEQNPTLYAIGVCGQIMADDILYEEFCGEECRRGKIYMCFLCR